MSLTRLRDALRQVPEGLALPIIEPTLLYSSVTLEQFTATARALADCGIEYALKGDSLYGTIAATLPGPVKLHMTCFERVSNTPAPEPVEAPIVRYVKDKVATHEVAPSGDLAKRMDAKFGPGTAERHGLRTTPQPISGRFDSEAASNA